MKAKTRAEEVFLILKGEVINKETKRIFSVGAIIGETDLVFKRERVESFEAVNNVYILKYDAVDFINIMN